MAEVVRLWDSRVVAIGPARSCGAMNCDSVGAIAPGKLAFFAMELNVPKDALLGKGFFAWTLMDGNRRRGMLQPIPIWIVP